MNSVSPRNVLDILIAISALTSVSSWAGVMQTVGTQEITRTQPEPARTWVSPSKTEDNMVSPNDRLEATQAVTFGFTGDQLGMARSNAGYTHVQILYWEEDDTPEADNRVGSPSTATYKFSGEGPTTVIYRPPGFVTTLAPHIGGFEGDTAEFEVEVDVPWGFNINSDQIWLSEGAIAGGVARGPRNGTEGIGYSSPDPHTGHASTPGSQGPFEVYTFRSDDGFNFEINGFNDSDFTLARASSDRLVHVSTSSGDRTLFDPSVSFTPVYLRDDPTVGELLEAGDVWAILDDAGADPRYFSGFMHTMLPTVLPLDGQTVTVPGGNQLASGDQALWITFETGPSSSAGFLLAVPEPETYAMFMAGLVLMGFIARRRKTA